MLELHDDEKEEVRHDMAAQPRFIEVQKGKISLAPSSVVVVESPKNKVIKNAQTHTVLGKNRPPLHIFYYI